MPLHSHGLSVRPFRLAALVATAGAFLLAAADAGADPLTDLLAGLPASVQALSRVPGPDDGRTVFFVVRETDGDRLFLGRKSASELKVVEIAEAAAAGGRVTDLRSEQDDLGLAAFVDLRNAAGEETTYELFLEGEDPASYIFRPASN